MKTTLFCVVVIAALLSSCATSTSQIELGMTYEQVREKLGKPRTTRSDLGCSQGMPGVSCTRTWRYGRNVRIKFMDGRVSGYR